MKLLKMLTPPIKATVIALMASAAFGDIYVAVNDPHAGDTPVEGRGTEELPYKTLQAAMEHDGGLASGTTVWVKPGTYAEGGAEADNNSNRVVVAAGVIVRATGTAAETIIQGASDPDTLNTVNDLKHELKGIGPKAVRCAYLNNNAVLRGFTLTGGRCRADTDTSGYGGCLKGGTGSAIIDCIVTGNRGRRGGALSGVKAIRCHLYGNTCTYTGGQAIGGEFYSCLLECAAGYDVYQPAKIVNCTFVGVNGSSYINTLLGNVYNTILLGVGISSSNGKYVYNTIYASTYASSLASDALDATTCRIKDATSVVLNDRKAPVAYNPAIGRCTDYEAYEALFPAAFRAEAAYDFYGNPRRREGAATFCAGAVETDPAVDELDWYVDDKNGDDDYIGDDLGSETHPFKTLQAAMDDERVLVGHTVWVKPGTYATGGKLQTAGGTTLNRVDVKAGVTLRSTDGAAKTIILGGEKTRCVQMANNAVLRGFTLQGGRPDQNASNEAQKNGGGLYATGATGAAAIDCVFSDNNGYRGGAVVGHISCIRCQFSGNTCGNTGTIGFGGNNSSDLYRQSFYNCLCDLSAQNSYALYQVGQVVNCTFFGSQGTTENVTEWNVYNSFMLRPFQAINEKQTFSCCCFGYSGTKPTAVTNGCQFADSADAFPLNYTYAPASWNTGRNACTNYAEYVSFFPEKFKGEAPYDLWGRPRKGADEEVFDVGCVEYDPALDRETWYVDAVNGDDSYAGDDLGFETHPYKTLQAAMDNARIYKGHVVYALPGVYREGGTGDATQSNRVAVVAGVTLVSTEGPRRTVIEGAPGTGKSFGELGPGAIRCVNLGVGATIRGFTLKGGHGGSADGASYGGGAYSTGRTLSRSAVEDCVITGCCAQRGAAAQGTVLNRCKVVDCKAAYIGIVNESTIYNSVFGPQNAKSGSYAALNCEMIRNCTFKSNLTQVNYSNGTRSTNEVRNCVIFGPYTMNANAYADCAFVDVPASNLSDANLGPGSFRTTEAKVLLDSACMPLAGSPVIDAGLDDVYPSEAGELDAFRGPRRLGAAIDIGAGEYDPDRTVLTFSDDTGVLTVSGLEVGANYVRPGEVLHYTVAAKEGTVRLARGFTVGDTYVSFDGRPAGWTYEGTLSGDAGKVALVADVRDAWYIDAVHGNDANDGFHPETAKKSFHGAFTNVHFAAGDTVYALPGEYKEDVYPSERASCPTLNRVVIPEKTRVVSTDGPSVTFIRGAMAPEGMRVATYAQYGVGTNSVRSVWMKANSVLRGFTVTDGTAWGVDASKYDTGANIVADATAYVVDCVISNGVAMRGGGAEGGRYIRCRFTDNRALSLGSSLYANLNLYGCVVEKGKGGGYCWYINQSTGKNKVVNSIFTADNGVASIRDNSNAAGCDLYNTVDLCGANQGIHYHAGCITVGKVSSSIVDPGVVITNAAAVGIGEGGIPARDSLATDTGVYEDFVTNWPSAYRDETLKDLVGTERILNRTIDVGAVEYDWKKDFAAELSGKPNFAVTAATTNVVLGADGGVVLSDGERMSAAWGARGRTTDVDYGFTVTVTGTGTLTYAVDGGEPVAVPAGTQTIALKGTNAAKTFDFAFTGDGSATLTAFTRRANVGVLLLVR